jgi:predicted phosphate transport protein (TIGR00153 family)
MLEKLMPKSNEFFDDFEKQAAATVEGAKLLDQLLSDFTEVSDKVREIKEVEHRSDEITRVAFERLHKQFITPFDRAEIHRMLSRIDDVLDLTDAAAERLVRYEISAIPEDARELSRILVQSCETVQEAVKSLRHIKKPQQIFSWCKEIKRHEAHADEVLRQSLADLFKSEKDPLTVIKWKEIYDLIESATDRCLDVANVIEGVVLEHS